MEKILKSEQSGFFYILARAMRVANWRGKLSRKVEQIASFRALPSLSNLDYARSESMRDQDYALSSRGSEENLRHALGRSLYGGEKLAPSSSVAFSL
jgi:hypothetical protein